MSQPQFTQIALGIPGAEGPVFDRAGRLFVVEPPAGRILQIYDDGRTREHANTGGIPAGLAVDAEDHLWVADMRRGLLRVSPDGTVEGVVERFEDKPIRGCNDLTIDEQGNIYFTAPAGSNADNPVGELYCRLIDAQVLRLDQGFAFCNGIALWPRGKMLVVAETFTRKLWAYDVVAAGRLANKRVWATLSGSHRGGPDGIDFDIDGNLLATNWGGGAIEVFDPHGKPLERIATPFEQPSNLHFGGADGCDLWITEHTNNAVWKTRWRRPGLLAIRRI
jgi:gluconolactonase